MSSVPWEWPNSNVLRVIDGDSIVGHMQKDVVVDCGFHVMLTQKVEAIQKLRLNRINAAPAKSPAGTEATLYLTTLLLGTNGLLLETLKVVAPYKFGDEWMVEITLPDGTNASDLMVTNNHAVYWNGSGPRPGG